MLKGTVKIELTDVVTGEKIVQEKSNMLTNATDNMAIFSMKHSIGHQSLNINTTHFNLLNGLVLWDTANTEDADNVWPHAGIKPVGYGCVGDTNAYTDISEWGIYNTQESNTSNPLSRKYVWDFSTSHVNKKIAGLSLTHYNAGFLGMGSETYYGTDRANYSRISTGQVMTHSKKGKQGVTDTGYGLMGTNLSLNNGTYLDFCIDSVNDVKYQLKVCQDGISIIKHSLQPEKFDIARTSFAWQSYEEETYAETFTGSHFWCFYNPDEKCLYFWTAGGDWQNIHNSSATITFNKFDMTNKTLTKAWDTETFSAGFNDSIYNAFWITGNDIYYARTRYEGTTQHYVIAKVNRASHTHTDIINRTDRITSISYSYYKFGYILNGLIYLPEIVYYSTYNYYTIIIDTSDDTVRYTHLLYDNNNNYRNVAIPPYDSTQMMFGSNLNFSDTIDNNWLPGAMSLQGTGQTLYGYGNVWTPVHYLGTIHNLSEPVIKTAQQTMKLTYTLEAVDME